MMPTKRDQQIKRAKELMADLAKEVVANSGLHNLTDKTSIGLHLVRISVGIVLAEDEIERLLPIRPESA